MKPAKDSLDLGILVSDINASLEFYRDILGLEYVGETPTNDVEAPLYVGGETRHPFQSALFTLLRYSMGNVFGFEAIQATQPLEVRCLEPTVELGLELLVHGDALEPVDDAHVARLCRSGDADDGVVLPLASPEKVGNPDATLAKRGGPGLFGVQLGQRVVARAMHPQHEGLAASVVDAEDHVLGARDQLEPRGAEAPQLERALRDRAHDIVGMLGHASRAFEPFRQRPP